jgi:hypothetical protein
MDTGDVTPQTKKWIAARKHVPIADLDMFADPFVKHCYIYVAILT